MSCNLHVIYNFLTQVERRQRECKDRTQPTVVKSKHATRHNKASILSDTKRQGHKNKLMTRKEQNHIPQKNHNNKR